VIFMDRQAYVEEVMDHYKNPRNKGKLEHADFCAHDTNPLCGDEISICAKVKAGKLQEIKFDGHGCAICIASSSMLMEKAAGKKLTAALKIKREDVLSNFGEISPVRTKCALLSLKVLKLGICGFLGKNAPPE